MNNWWVYVLQSLEVRHGKRGQPLPGTTYVGSTTDPVRRLDQHNGLRPGGGKHTAGHRPYIPRALFGPYANRSEAFKAEMALKHSKRGEARVNWSPDDSPWCRGLGAQDPWVQKFRTST